MTKSENDQKGCSNMFFKTKITGEGVARLGETVTMLAETLRIYMVH